MSRRDAQSASPRCLAGGRTSVAWLLLAFAFVSACTTVAVPVEHTRLYAESTAKTRDAGGLVLDRISPIVAGVADSSAVEECGPDPGTSIPRCFNQNLVAASTVGSSDPPAVAASRLALDLVAAYAAVLADLAEGRSGPELQAEIGTAADSAGALVAVTSGGVPASTAVQALSPQVQTLSGRLEAARAGQIVRQAIVADRDTIKALLKALEAETPRIYEIYSTKRKLDLLAAARAKDRVAADAIINDIKAFHTALDAYVRLLRASAAALDILARDVQQAAPSSPQAAQASLRQAIDARVEAQVLWNTVRQADSNRR